MTTAIRAYRIKGTTNDVTTCDLCGREDLKRTVALYVLDPAGNPDDVVYFGTDCASRATGWTQQRITRDAKQADKAERLRQIEHKREEARKRDEAEHEVFNAWLMRHFGTTDDRDNGKLKRDWSYRGSAKIRYMRACQEHATDDPTPEMAGFTRK